MTFRVGQKVVCVDGNHWMPLRHSEYVVEGRIYTVSEVDSGGVNVVGIRPDPFPLGEGNYVWDSARFRPIVERKTDISVFTEMLRTTKAPQLDEVQS